MHCVSVFTITVAGAISDVIVDFAILLIPLPFVSKPKRSLVREPYQRLNERIGLAIADAEAHQSCGVSGVSYWTFVGCQMFIFDGRVDMA